MKRINAKRVLIPAGFKWHPQQQMDFWKVQDLRSHIRAGGKVPPVVVALYGESYMPIDGHHRTSSHDEENLPLDAWVVSGRTFDNLDSFECRAEEQIFCGGVPAMQVADHWKSLQGAES